MTTEKRVVKSIRERALAILKMDDKAKSNKFFDRQVRNLKREIKNIKANIKAKEMNFDNSTLTYQDKREDLIDAVESAQENIDVSKLNSNSNMDEYAVSYWKNIDHLEYKVKDLDRYQELLQGQHDIEISSMKEDIEKYEERIRQMK